MSAHKKTVAALASHNRMRIAAGAFVPPEQPPEAQSKIGGGAPMTENAKRVIPDDFSFDPRSLKPLVQTLWAMSVALGHALTAHRQFARIKSSTISPDGLLGGRGYIMGIKDVRQRLYESCESLSAIVDTIHDEVNAAHWKPKLGELEKSEVEDLKRLLTDTEENLEDPEGEAEEDMEAVEHGRPQNWNPGGSERFDKGDEGSQLPGANGQKDAPPRPAKKPKQASYERRVIANFRGSNSAPSWSPDGRTLAVTLSRDGGSQLFAIDAQGGEPRRLTQSAAIDTEPVFAPDGSAIYFVSDRGGVPQIYRMPASGGPANRVTFNGTYNISPSISPDGRWLTYISRIGGAFKLHVMDIASGNVAAITDSNRDERPSFAPNSRLIVYATIQDGREALMTTTLDGRIKARLSGQGGDLREPNWGPFSKILP